MHTSRVEQWLNRRECEQLSAEAEKWGSPPDILWRVHHREDECNKTLNFDIRRGVVDSKEVQVLVDTDFELCEEIWRERPDQLMDKELFMITIDGVGKVVPVAKINVDTPNSNGEIEAMVQ